MSEPAASMIEEGSGITLAVKNLKNGSLNSNGTD